jgi:spore coat polysaccharide biosynthesis protein SpsF (cytidylyltransferase family)
MSKQQTAVEWLLDRMEDVDLSESMWESIKKQARQMEREQIIEAHDEGEGMIVGGGKQYYSKKYRR